ncbi:hypothetical protein [Providencia rettgeri]|uniref:DUF1281 family ferredoxin-like fold protein n=1 Tax=Providencia rettgeri TaxID=587 RepID=UPI002361C72A|nr:hypothetical protein [Providencia rettgeri]
MPNHVTNELIMTSGTSKEKLNVLNNIINNEGIFDFNRLIKMPKTLNITSGSHTEMMAAAIRENDKGVFERFKKQLGLKRYKKLVNEAKQSIKNEALYGHATWYSWRISNWGTKWGAYDVLMPIKPKSKKVKYGHRHTPTHVKCYEKRIYKKRLKRHIANGGELIIKFDTAWSTPEQIYAALGNKFSQHSFTVRFADEDLGSNCGTFDIINGNLVNINIAKPYREQSESEKLHWRKFAFHLCHPELSPSDYGMDENYQYTDDE